MRQNTGASLGLVAAAALLIVLAIIGGFKLMVYLGGSQELRNSVDAAALNVSKRAVENKVPCQVGSGYDDVADSTGNVGLTNINRVIGKAYLINANAEQMLKNGFDSGQGSANARQAFTQAETIIGNLYTLLKSKDAADVHFKQISQGKPAKLLGQEGAVTTSKDSDWAVAWVYRGEESNLAVDKAALPQTVNPPNLIQMKNGTYYMQGFNSMQANSDYFCFTTFHVGEAPHLISSSAFDQAQAGVANAVNPIPNAFKEAGQINGNLALTASACAVANPMRSYNLAIPHSYITISLANQALFIVQGTPYASIQYTPETGKVWQVRNYSIKKPGKGLENGYATLGLEYQPATLWHAVHDALPGDHTVVVNTLLQRIKEFCPGYTAQNFQTLLQNTPLTEGVDTWFIYPTYTQPDLSDPKVNIAPATGALPGWINRLPPDGIAKGIYWEQDAHDYANTCFSNIRGGPYPTDKHYTDETGTFNWHPGTGFTQCLGALQISRTTTVTFTALP